MNVMQLGLLLLSDIELGGYISIWKVVLVLLLLLAWAWVVAWIDKDAPAAHLPREVLNTSIFLAGILGFVLFFLVRTTAVPGFLTGFSILLLFLGGGPAAYLIIRARAVGLGDLRQSLGELFSAMGRKNDKKQALSAGAVQVQMGKGGALMPVPEAEDPARSGYDAAQQILTDPLRRNAERIEVRPGEGAASVQFVVDGMAYSGLSLDRHSAAAGITWLKTAAGLDINDRRKPQRGPLKVSLDGKRRELEIATAGSTAGESLLVLTEPKKRNDFRMEDLGLLPDQLAALKATIAEPGSIILLASPPQQGLTSMLYACLRGHDAFVQHLQTIERRPPVDLEGITQSTLPSNATAAEEAKLMDWVVSQQPDAIMIDQIDNPATAKALAKFVGTEKHAYVGIRAASTFDALTIWRKLVGDDKLAMKTVGAVLCSRVLRRLCQACKVGYAPDPEMLRKLNMDSNRVQRLFQARTQPVRDAKGNPILCEFCQELRYKGRMGVFELLVVDEDIRRTILSGGTTQQLRPAFRKQRGRYLQETALLQVEQGETSVQEVLRVLRGPEPAGAAAPAAKPSAAATPAAKRK